MTGERGRIVLTVEEAANCLGIGRTLMLDFRTFPGESGRVAIDSARHGTGTGDDWPAGRVSRPLTGCQRVAACQVDGVSG